jgi:hypothetical protein
VLDGIVLTVEGVRGLQRRGCARVLAALRAATRVFEDAPLVVRSSSTVEDAATGSTAGQFTSVPDVRGWDALREAVAVEGATTRFPPGAVVDVDGGTGMVEVVAVDVSSSGDVESVETST